MSSKRKTPKKKSKEDDILFQAVHKMIPSKSKTPKNKTPKSKTPKNKTPKQKGGEKQDPLLKEVKDLLFSMNNSEFDGIGIKTTFMPLDGNKDNINQLFSEVKHKTAITSMAPSSNTNNKNRGGNKSFRVIQTFEEEDDPKPVKGGYGKKYINNNVRLYEELQKNHLFDLL